MNKVHDLVIKKILGLFRQGKIIWKQPYYNINQCNFITGRPYSGINKLLLAMNPDTFYLTRKQAEEIGGTIKHGERYHIITFWKINSKEETVNGNSETKTYPTFRFFQTYGLSQVDLPEGKMRQLMDQRVGEIRQQRINMPVSRFIVNTGIKVVESNPQVPHYHPKNDVIHTKPSYLFNSGNDKARTELHEIGHATGHPNRLNRDLSGNRMSEEYGVEELIAELISCMLAQEFGIADYGNTTAYLQGWTKAIQKDHSIIFTASKKAEEGVEYLKNIVGSLTPISASREDRRRNNDDIQF